MQPQQIPDVLLSLLNVPDLVILAVVLHSFPRFPHSTLPCRIK